MRRWSRVDPGVRCFVAAVVFFAASLGLWLCLLSVGLFH